ncbi:MAG: AAA family ATPase [bacterium]|nr:AAA family ATPase [bacterium]
MARCFNVTGICIPREHFMAFLTEKIERIKTMVDSGYYFTINRPRQYGKTTTMYLLEQLLKENRDYLVIDISFEGIDAVTHSNQARFITTILDIVSRRFLFMGEKALADYVSGNKDIDDFNRLSSVVTQLIGMAARKVVLMIDEVDKSSNNQLFLDFLGMLRSKYLAAKAGKDFTFQSVILAGVHDVKSLKAKILPGATDGKFNSPWNIASDFKIDLSLFPEEIETMLSAYAQEKNVEVDVPFFGQKLFYYTSGYPFLVSYLCRIIDEDILPKKNEKKWHPHDLEMAVQSILKEGNTNFDSLIKNLENNPELYEFAFNIIMNEKEYSFNKDNPIINFGLIYGVFEERDNRVRIHNRIYEQRIYNYMTSRLESSPEVEFYNVDSSFLDADGFLDVERVIKKFQAFMKEQYSERDSDFIERNGRLLFLSFLKPIINGKGFDFKEVQISEEKRLDVVITYLNKKYIVELKIWRGEAYHREGVKQLCDYLELQSLREGCLLIFDLRKESNRIGKTRRIKQQGKEIFTAWV